MHSDAATQHGNARLANAQCCNASNWREPIRCAHNPNMLALPRFIERALPRSPPTPPPHAQTGTPADPRKLLQCLQPCDVMLVEGSTRISTAIKYLTQSTWSHATL